MSLCNYAVKLTLEPGATGAADIDALRNHAWSDESILIATQVISYFNYINRVADALHVDDESWMTPRRDEWLAAKGRRYRG
ncbi:MAG: hypothetical protein ACYTGR_01570 [Planctomycetota bacterium]|jgi:alkylhydroperoxidase family enzyme